MHCNYICMVSYFFILETYIITVYDQGKYSTFSFISNTLYIGGFHYDRIRDQTPELRQAVPE